MDELFRAISDPVSPFLRNAFIAGLFASVACGVIGSYVVARRISYIAGSISHCVLGGIGVALYLSREAGVAWFDPMYGAVAVALSAAAIIAWISLKFRQREDTVIGALWAIGMAVGLLFSWNTRGFQSDLMSYLFGSIDIVSGADIRLIGGLNVLVVGVAVLTYDKMLAVCFDEEFARLRGVNVGFYYVLLLCLTALTVVLMVRVVGVMMVIALLTLPSAVASFLSRKLWQMMLYSTAFCMLFTMGGIAFSYLREFPSGPCIVMFAGATYLIAVATRALFGAFGK